MRCRFRLARPAQQQLAGHASGRLMVSRFPIALGFFRHPFFKRKLVLDAASFHDTILLIGTTHKLWFGCLSVPFPTSKPAFTPLIG
jgi:hypothetical protein